MWSSLSNVCWCKCSGQREHLFLSLIQVNDSDLVIVISANDWLERLISEMTCYLLMRSIPAHLPSFWERKTYRLPFSVGNKGKRYALCWCHIEYVCAVHSFALFVWCGPWVICHNIKPITVCPISKSQIWKSNKPKVQLQLSQTDQSPVTKSHQTKSLINQNKCSWFYQWY